MKNKAVLTKKHTIIEIVSFAIMLAALIIGIIVCASGKEIPIHFDIEGNVTEYGSGGSVLILPIIMLLTNVIMCLILRCLPFSCWNMPVKVKPEREVIVYGCVGYMLVVMELLFSLFTLFSSIFMLSGNEAAMNISAILLVISVFVDIILGIIFTIKKNA